MCYQGRATLQSEPVIAGAFTYAVAVVWLKDYMLWDYNKFTSKLSFLFLSDVFACICHMELPYRGCYLHLTHIQNILGVILF